MSIEDRLLLLLIQARQTGGDAALHDAAGLRSRLSSQAPDLHGEIQAMAAALAMGAPVRIANAADAEAERNAIAADIARQERLSMSVVEPGLAVACQGGAGIGPADSSPARPAGGDDWAGDSIVVGGDALSSHKPGEDNWAGDSIAVGAAPPPASAPSLDKGYSPPPQAAAPPPFAPPPQPYQSPQGGYGPGPYGAPAPKPFYTQTWFFALVAAFIIAAAVGYTLWRNWGGTTTTTSAAPVQPGPQPGPPTPAAEPQPGGPVLSADSNSIPTLTLQATASGRNAIGFRVVSDGGPIDAILMLPAGGWEGESSIMATNGAGARSIGTGSYQLQIEGQAATPIRAMPIQWSQDGVGAGDSQVTFIGRNGESDVTLRGSLLCITDGSGNEIIGCGRVQ